jgi:hypothetical protein
MKDNITALAEKILLARAHKADESTTEYHASIAWQLAREFYAQREEELAKVPEKAEAF